MGVSYYTYLGPYIEARNSQEDVIKQRRSCTNVKCKRRGDHIYDQAVKFCDQCGTAIGDVTYKEAAPKVSAWEIAEENKLSVMSTEYVNEVPKGTDIFVGNIRSDGRKFSQNARESRMVEVTAQLIVDETVAFIKQYETGIAALKAAYGEANVSVKWGLVQYAN